LSITSTNQIDKHKTRTNEKELREWAQLKTQGKVISALVSDRIGNSWLASSTLFRASKLITALKLRPNVAGDRAALARTKITNESLLEVLGTERHTGPHLGPVYIHEKGKKRETRHDQGHLTMHSGQG
jgi:hypothetical protein